MINMIITETVALSSGSSDANPTNPDGMTNQNDGFLAVLSKDSWQTGIPTEDNGGEQDRDLSEPIVDMLFSTAKIPQPAMGMLDFMAIAQKTLGQEFQPEKQVTGGGAPQAESLTLVGDYDPEIDINTAKNKPTLPEFRVNLPVDNKAFIAGNDKSSAPVSAFGALEIVNLDTVKLNTDAASVSMVVSNEEITGSPLNISTKDIGVTQQTEISVKQPVSKHNIIMQKELIAIPQNAAQELTRPMQNAAGLPEVKKLAQSSEKQIPAAMQDKHSDKYPISKMGAIKEQVVDQISNGAIGLTKPLKLSVKPVEHSNNNRSAKTEDISAKRNNKIESKLNLQSPEAPAAKKPFTAEQPQLVSHLGEMGPAEKVTTETSSLVGISETSAPVAAKTYADTTIHRPEMARHVAQQLAEAAKHMPNRPIELSLNPEELGRVRMTFTINETGINVAVLTERGETMDLLRRNIETLAQEFRELGHKDVNFNFSSNSQKNDAQKKAGNDAGNNSEIELLEADMLEPAQISLGQMNGLDIRL